MTKRELALASLVLLPLGLGMAGGAIAGSTQTAIPQHSFKVAENNQENGNAAEVQDGTQNEGNVESNDGAQDEGNVESNGNGQDEGGANSEHESEGEENGEN